MTFQDINLQSYFKMASVKSVLWPALVSNVVDVSLSGGSLGYWTACNNVKRYCTVPYCVHEQYIYKLRNMYTRSDIWEGLFIEVSGHNLHRLVTIGNIYRPPHNNNNNANIETFIEEMSPIINRLQKINKYATIVGDFNINLLQISERDKFDEFFDLMCTNKFFPKITLPTRSSKWSCTLIDQMFCKSPHLDHANISSTIIMSNISDHFPCMVKLEILKDKPDDPNTYKSGLYLKQQFKILMKNFVLRIYRCNWVQIWGQSLILSMIFLNGLLWQLMKNIFPINVWKWTNININSLHGSHQVWSNQLNFATNYISDIKRVPRIILNITGWKPI